MMRALAVLAILLAGAGSVAAQNVTGVSVEGVNAALLMPAGGKARGAIVLLAGAAVAGWYVYQRVQDELTAREPVPVPNVVGIKQARAVDLIEEAELEADVQQTFSDEVPKGEVIDQDPTAGTRIAKGETVSITVSAGVEQVAVPSDGLFAQYYAQAINKNAPHPAAARLWQEFLFSDAGQNLWLAGKARPVRLDEMTVAGTADKALLAALPQVEGEPQFPTQEETDAAKAVVAQQWASATS